MARQIICPAFDYYLAARELKILPKDLITSPGIGVISATLRATAELLRGLSRSRPRQEIYLHSSHHLDKVDVELTVSVPESTDGGISTESHKLGLYKGPESPLLLSSWHCSHSI